jgi:divalent metal cation (Fe/Co/Zn/Cd) transporter
MFLDIAPYLYRAMLALRGLWALKWSGMGLRITAGMQLVVAALSGSMALLADTLHNFGDATMALSLWVAFLPTQSNPTPRFTYGLGRTKDLVGMAIVLIMALSSPVAGYEAITRLIHPQPVTHLGIALVASLLSFPGNEPVVLFRIKVDQEISTAVLVADGFHARVDGWTRLAVLGGLLVTAATPWLVGQSGAIVLIRVLDRVDPGMIDELRHAAAHVSGVRARWMGHDLQEEMSIAVSPELSLAEDHAMATEVRHQLLHHVRYLGEVGVHVDPLGQAGTAVPPYRRTRPRRHSNTFPRLRRGH